MINILEYVNQSIRAVTLNQITSGLAHTKRWPLYKGEHEQYKLDWSDAYKHLKDNLPNYIEVERFALTEHSPQQGYYSTLIIKLINKTNKTPSISTSSLTPVEIYEQNKNSLRCVGCSKPTQSKAVLSSMINYCESCSG